MMHNNILITMNFISKNTHFFKVLFVLTLVLSILVSIFGSLSENMVKDPVLYERLGYFFKKLYFVFFGILIFTATPLFPTYMIWGMTKINIVHPSVIFTFFIKNKEIAVALFTVIAWAFYTVGFVVSVLFG